MRRLEITARGIVQDVGFRNHAEQEAHRLGLTGLVWNDPDGSVRIVAEGPEGKLHELLEWSRGGPGHARVDQHDFHWTDPSGEFDGFAVRR